MQEFEVCPDPEDTRLSTPVRGIDQNGESVETAVVAERPLTLFLNSQEIVTMMTINAVYNVSWCVGQTTLRRSISASFRKRKNAAPVSDWAEMKDASSTTAIKPTRRTGVIARSWK